MNIKNNMKIKIKKNDEIERKNRKRWRKNLNWKKYRKRDSHVLVEKDIDYVSGYI